MNREAINSFLTLVNQSGDLREKVDASQKEAQTHGTPATFAEALAALSTTAGSPVSMADWQAFLKEKSAGTLDDGELEKVAGGFTWPPIQIRLNG